MVSKRQIARDISYAGSAETRSGRTMIRMMENVTGRPGLIRRADGYEQDIAAGQDFWQVMVQRYGLSLRITGGSLDAIPQTGPLVLIANHPYGILDGLVLGHILSQCRGDFRILANRVFCKAADLNRVILPISFDPSKSAVQTKLETRRIALNYLGGGGAVGVFPGGTVSTASRWFARPMDPAGAHSPHA